jgi:hypothetical protein
MRSWKIAQAAGNAARTLGGSIGGTFGGLNNGLGVLGKISVGDNKTIHALMTTFLQKLAMCGAEETAILVFSQIPNSYTPQATPLTALTQLCLSIIVVPNLRRPAN